MKKRNTQLSVVLGIIFLLTHPDFLIAQVDYASEKLFQIGSQLPKKCLESKDLLINCPEIIAGKSIVIRYDEQQKVSHLGIDLFAPSTRKIVNPTICEFIERLCLELLLHSDSKKIVDELKKNNLTLQHNQVDFGSKNFTSFSAFLQKITPETAFYLHQTPSAYTAIWKPDQNESFTLSFPVERELISGKNKKEADEELNNRLNKSDFSYNIVLDTVFSSSGLKFLSEKNIYERKGKYYVNESINDNVYYIKQADNLFCIVNDQEFPKESISNQFLGYVENEDLKLKIVHKSYAILPDIDISLKNFLCFFKEDFDLYCAVQEKHADSLNITLVLRSRSQNYIHLLAIKTTEQNVFQGKELLNAELYSYIPQHNLKTPLY